jgi:AcrR family transcriptional regulator
VTDRRLERGATTRAHLIDTARQMFGTDGYERTSIDAILRESGVAKGALYHHFPSKEALFDAVLDRVVADLAAEAADAARVATDPADALRNGCARWLHLAAQDPAIQQIVLLDAPAVVGWQRWRELDEIHTLGGVRTSLRRLAREGRLPEADVDVLANMVLAAVNEAILLVPGADDPAAAVERGLRALNVFLDRLVGG